jgi:hypothetical protein
MNILWIVNTNTFLLVILIIMVSILPRGEYAHSVAEKECHLNFGLRISGKFTRLTDILAF